MAEKERQMNKKVNSVSAKLKTEEEEVCVVNVKVQVAVISIHDDSWCVG